VCFLAFPSLAHGLVHGSQFWSLNTLRGPIDREERWQYYLEVQPRLDLESSARTRILLRPALILNLDGSQSIWAGVLDLTGSDFSTLETRIWEQYQRSDRIGDVTLVNRTRLEERMRRGATDLGFRVRHLLRAQVPISNQKDWFVVLFDELFLGLNQNQSQPASGFDQNRLFGGFRVEMKDQLSLEFGYLNQHDGARMNHIPFLSISKIITDQGK
jgi:hypothetical protein